MFRAFGQRNLYPPVFYCALGWGQGFSGQVRPVGVDAIIIEVADERYLRPQRFDEPRFGPFVATLQGPQAVVGHLQARVGPRVSRPDVDATIMIGVTAVVRPWGPNSAPSPASSTKKPLGSHDMKHEIPHRH